MKRRRKDAKVVGAALFLSAFFFVDVSIGNISFYTQTRPIEMVLLGLLMVAGIVAGRYRGRGLSRMFITGSTTLITVALYWWFRQSSPAFGSPVSYLRSGFLYAIFVTLITGFAWFIYDEALFLDLFWRIGRFSLIVGLIGYVLTSSLGVVVMTNTGYGTPRFQGFLSEPSAWGPVIPALLILALQRKSRWVVGLCIIAIVLSKSPTVLLSTAVAVPLFYLLRTGKGSTRKVVGLAAIAALGLWTFNWMQTADYKSMIVSKNAVEVSLGRLISGLQNVQTGGIKGYNSRYSGAQDTLDELHAANLTYTGLGPGSSDVYFIAKYGDTKSYSFLLAVLFDFGILGLAALVLAVLAALRRMRYNAAASVFVPFLVAGCINSAEGWETYKFDVLALVIFLTAAAKRTTGQTGEGLLKPRNAKHGQPSRANQGDGRDVMTPGVIRSAGGGAPPHETRSLIR